MPYQNNPPKNEEPKDDYNEFDMLAPIMEYVIVVLLVAIIIIPFVK